MKLLALLILAGLAAAAALIWLLRSEIPESDHIAAADGYGAWGI